MDRKSKKYLDLSFGAKQQSNQSALRNGVRPHGGVKGQPAHPLNLYSFSKEESYQQEMRESIDQLFEEEYLAQCGSPKYAVRMSNEEVVHSGESALFSNKLLAPSRLEQRGTSMTLHSPKRPKHKYDPPVKSRTQQQRFYRPNSTHQFLTKTELKNSTAGEVDVKLGKPTRTTLLRARQRRNSAPGTTHNERRKMREQIEQQFQRPESARSTSSSLNSHVPVEKGESVHAFLTGARYNRAQYLDSRSLFEYGIYLSRTNPGEVYISAVPPKGQGHHDDDQTPRAPPDSPNSSCSSSEDEYSRPIRQSQSLNSGPGSFPRRTPRPNTAKGTTRTRHAWGEEDECVACKSGSDNLQDPRLLNHIMSSPDMLNIQGYSINNPHRERAQSARPLFSSGQKLSIQISNISQHNVMPQRPKTAGQRPTGAGLSQVSISGQKMTPYKEVQPIIKQHLATMVNPPNTPKSARKLSNMQTLPDHMTVEKVQKLQKTVTINEDPDIRILDNEGVSVPESPCTDKDINENIIKLKSNQIDGKEKHLVKSEEEPVEKDTEASKEEVNANNTANSKEDDKTDAKVNAEEINGNMDNVQDNDNVNDITEISENKNSENDTNENENDEMAKEIVKPAETTEKEPLSIIKDIMNSEQDKTDDDNIDNDLKDIQEAMKNMETNVTYKYLEDDVIDELHKDPDSNNTNGNANEKSQNDSATFFMTEDKDDQKDDVTPSKAEDKDEAEIKNESQGLRVAETIISVEIRSNPGS
ncbi:unnamed protein product [Owenia fusiformis]|uniref:Uncharacterized protein n=1 Tax=Owenia fusiformis TaxID=6347 RepID=A0A8S4NKG8_OWEFU|nr:unnamed protein product [Owenia fusiformis]